MYVFTDCFSALKWQRSSVSKHGSVKRYMQWHWYGALKGCSDVISLTFNHTHKQMCSRISFWCTFIFYFIAHNTADWLLLQDRTTTTKMSICPWFLWEFTFQMRLSFPLFLCQTTQLIYLSMVHVMFLSGALDHSSWLLTNAVPFLVEIAAIMNTCWSWGTCYRCNLTERWFCFIYCISHVLIHSHICILT